MNTKEVLLFGTVSVLHEVVIKIDTELLRIWLFCVSSCAFIQYHFCHIYM